MTIAYRIVNTSLFQLRLLQNTVQGPYRQIIARFARNRNPSCFGRLLELRVAPAGRDEKPAIGMKHPKYLVNLHVGRILPLAAAVKDRGLVAAST